MNSEKEEKKKMNEQEITHEGNIISISLPLFSCTSSASSRSRDSRLRSLSLCSARSLFQNHDDRRSSRVVLEEVVGLGSVSSSAGKME